MSIGSRRPRGFTMVELMITLVISSILAGGILALLAHQRDHVRWQNALLLQELQARAALDTLGRDLRQAARVELADEELSLADDGELGVVEYGLTAAEAGDGRLLIRQAGSERRVLAASVRRFQLERGPGRLVVRLELEERLGAYRARTARGTTVALIRAAGGGS